MYDIQSALRRRALAERLEDLDRAHQALEPPHDPGPPFVADPAVTDPAVTEPAVADPAVADPAVTDPAVTESVASTIADLLRHGGSALFFNRDAVPDPDR
jgi:hypothetical protein